MLSSFLVTLQYLSKNVVCKAHISLSEEEMLSDFFLGCVGCLFGGIDHKGTLIFVWQK